MVHTRSIVIQPTKYLLPYQLWHQFEVHLAIKFHLPVVNHTLVFIFTCFQLPSFVSQLNSTFLAGPYFSLALYSIPQQPFQSAPSHSTTRFEVYNVALIYKIPFVINLGVPLWIPTQLLGGSFGDDSVVAATSSSTSVSSSPFFTLSPSGCKNHNALCSSFYVQYLPLYLRSNWLLLQTYVDAPFIRSSPPLAALCFSTRCASHLDPGLLNLCKHLLDCATPTISSSTLLSSPCP